MVFAATVMRPVVIVVVVGPLLVMATIMRPVVIVVVVAALLVVTAIVVVAVVSILAVTIMVVLPLVVVVMAILPTVSFASCSTTSVPAGTSVVVVSGAAPPRATPARSPASAGGVCLL